MVRTEFSYKITIKTLVRENICIARKPKLYHFGRKVVSIFSFGKKRSNKSQFFSLLKIKSIFILKYEVLFENDDFHALILFDSTFLLGKIIKKNILSNNFHAFEKIKVI